MNSSSPWGTSFIKDLEGRITFRQIAATTEESPASTTEHSYCAAKLQRISGWVYLSRLKLLPLELFTGAHTGQVCLILWTNWTLAMFPQYSKKVLSVFVIVRLSHFKSDISDYLFWFFFTYLFWFFRKLLWQENLLVCSTIIMVCPIICHLKKIHILPEQ